MAEFYNLIRNAIAELPQNTGTARRAVYERARVALVDQLRAVQPPLSPGEITKHRLSLEDCIRRVEQEASDVALGARNQTAAQQGVEPNFGRLPSSDGYQVPPLQNAAAQRSHAGFAPNLQPGGAPVEAGGELQFDFRGGGQAPAPTAPPPQDPNQGFSAPFQGSGHARPLDNAQPLNNGQAAGHHDPMYNSGMPNGQMPQAPSAQAPAPNGQMAMQELGMQDAGMGNPQFGTNGAHPPASAPMPGNMPVDNTAQAANLSGDLGAGMGQVVRAAEEAARRGTADFAQLSTAPATGNGAPNAHAPLHQIPDQMAQNGFNGAAQAQMMNGGAGTQDQFSASPTQTAGTNGTGGGWANPPMGDAGGLSGGEDPQDVIDRAINTLNREAQSVKNPNGDTRDPAKALDSLNSAFNRSFSNLESVAKSVAPQPHQNDAPAAEPTVAEPNSEVSDAGQQANADMNALAHALANPDGGATVEPEAHAVEEAHQHDVVDVVPDAERTDGVVFDEAAATGAPLQSNGGGEFSALGEQMPAPNAPQTDDVIALDAGQPTLSSPAPIAAPDLSLNGASDFSATPEPTFDAAVATPNSMSADVGGLDQVGGYDDDAEDYGDIDYDQEPKRSKLGLVLGGSFLLLLLSIGSIFVIWPETYRLAVATISGVADDSTPDSNPVAADTQPVVSADRTVGAENLDQSDGQRDAPLSSQVSALTESERLSPNDVAGTPEVASSIRAQSLLLEQAANPSEAVPPFNGNVSWSQEQDASGLPVLIGSAKIPARNISMRIEIRKNADPALPASHVMEVRFDTSPGFVGGGVATMPGIVMKQQKFSNGTPLAGAHARVRDNQFLFALSSTDADIRKNTALLGDLQWMDIPIVYNTGQRAIFSLEKGEEGAKLFQDTLVAWGDG